MDEPVQQIIIERAAEGFEWSIFGTDRRLASGAAPTARKAVESLLRYLEMEAADNG